jgi:hypothetical protein
MKTNKTDTIRLRIHPDKKAALDSVAKDQQLDISKLLMAQIEKLIAQEPLNLDADENGEGQGDEDNPLTMRLSFRPLPGDEQRLNRYAAARSTKPSVVMKLVLRAWLSHNAPMPRKELALLGITSNQIAAIGRSLNQLVKLAHAGDYPPPEELAALLQETLNLIRQASQEIDNIVKINLISWESDNA